MAEIFKTNVQNTTAAKQVISLLQTMFSEAAINFDLHDHDKILRVEGIDAPDLESVISSVRTSGFTCELLD